MKHVLLSITILLGSCTPLYAQPYKGGQTAPWVSTADMQALRNQGANIARYQIHHFWGSSSNYNCNEYRQVIISQTEFFLTNHSTDIGMKYILVLMVPFGGRVNQVDQLFANETMRACMVEGLKDMVVRTQHSPVVLGWDVYNEPLGGTHAQVNRFIRRLYTAVRSINSTKIVVVKPRHDSPEFYNKMSFIARKNVWYGVHMYWPGKFTHNGIFAPHTKIATYPRTPDPNARAKMEVYLKHVIEFQKKYGVTIYISEFGSSIYCTENSRFLWFRDVIALSRKYRWNWTYHAWREASVWDIEQYPRIINLFRNRWSN